MLAFSRRTLCAATAAAATAASSTAAGASQGPQRSGLIDRARSDKFEVWAKSKGIKYDGVSININEDQGRGIKAIRKFYQGQTVVQVPLRTATLSEETLTPYPRDPKSGAVTKTPGPHDGWATQTLINANVPSLENVKSLMLLHGCHDPMMYRQFHLALALAVERMDPNSPYAPYFDTLPHPAIDDEAVMGLHKSILDLGQKIEWQDYLNEFHLMAKEMRERWPQAPPEGVILWAWRTILARNNPLPNRHFENVASQDGALHFRSLFEVKQAQTLYQRLKARFMDGESHIKEYELIPTLTPVVDLVSHVGVANVAVELRTITDTSKPEESGATLPVVELQAISTIMPGETIGYRFSRSHEVPFTLFRFGFLPL